MAYAMQQQSQAWHNPLPGWIVGDIAAKGDSRVIRGVVQTLQAMADAGDVDAQGVG